ncbi:MAG: electron transfer flavoprotein subunit beta/FixA family protein [Firmicutes bacterium]|jgi:electron transfer flavoprotein beta subunit|nr:electron transfer flavoprotein subunit beta/FixA family protein [Bacillota bacterium]
MKIIVCIKQVPDTTEVKINKETNTLIREGVASVINPFDLYAIEEGLRLREAHGGTVTVLSMGPMQVIDSLREALSMGADEAVLLSDRAFAGADTLATAYTLSKGIEKIGSYDLIICGKQAIDGDTAQVGPELAEMLEIPHVTYVRRIHEIAGGQITVERMTEEGSEKIRFPLPGLITVVKEINEPRLPSIKGKMRAKKAEIPVWSAGDLGTDPEKTGLKGSPTWVTKVFTPEQKGGGEIFEGEVGEQVAKLVRMLRETKIV